MEIISLFLPAPILYVVMAFLPKNIWLGSGAIIAGIAVAFVPALLPPITGSDPAGNGMANGFRAILFFASALGLIAGGAFALFYSWASLADRPIGLRILAFIGVPMIALGLVSAATW